MRYIILVFISVLFLACSDDRTNRNPFLQEVDFGFEVNLNLPLYSPLTNTGNAVLISNNGVGTKGVYVINTGFNTYRVFEASCPNHVSIPCATLVANGQVATCSCEGFEYSLFTGQQFNIPEDGTRYYDMLEYRARFSGGNTVFISN